VFSETTFLVIHYIAGNVGILKENKHIELINLIPVQLPKTGEGKYRAVEKNK
jgi:hypothetical protein